MVAANEEAHPSVVSRRANIPVGLLYRHIRIASRQVIRWRAKVMSFDALHLATGHANLGFPGCHDFGSA